MCIKIGKLKVIIPLDFNFIILSKNVWKGLKSNPDSHTQKLLLCDSGARLGQKGDWRTFSPRAFGKPFQSTFCTPALLGREEPHCHLHLHKTFPEPDAYNTPLWGWKC